MASSRGHFRDRGKRSAPKGTPCLGCGAPVSGARPSDPEPYHEACRRCSSCLHVVSGSNGKRLAGRLLCKVCYGLFGPYFASDASETFEAWDDDGSGSISSDEAYRVLMMLDPSLLPHDLDMMLKAVDINGDGSINYNEFCQWFEKENVLALSCASGEDLVCKLMGEAGKAANDQNLGIAAIQVKPAGVTFTLHCGVETVEAKALVGSSDILELRKEDYIRSVEGKDSTLILGVNTGHVEKLDCLNSFPFGPWAAPKGFYICGLRTKPGADEESDRIVGVDLHPLPAAPSYEPRAAVRFAAEHGFSTILQPCLAKGIPLNTFSPGGVTELMLAVEGGDCRVVRALLKGRSDPNIADFDGETALTFAHRSGEQQVAELLLSYHATEAGDGGAAWREEVLARPIMDVPNDRPEGLICRRCGEPVSASEDKSCFPMHRACRRCSSCAAELDADKYQMLMGQMLCKPCSVLFAPLFVADAGSPTERMKEAFESWDADGNGKITTDEVARVLEALNPDLDAEELSSLFRSVDKNQDGNVDIGEFCEWVMEDRPLELSHSSLQELVATLMRRAASAADRAGLIVTGIQAGPTGLTFVLQGGKEVIQTAAMRGESSMQELEPTEFIMCVDIREEEVHFILNSGRSLKFVCSEAYPESSSPGPFQAPQGFHIVGLRTKPCHDDVSGDRLVGVRLRPFRSADKYDVSTSLRYAAEHGFLDALKRLLFAKVPLNTFGPDGASELMLAAEKGNDAAVRLLLSSGADPSLADSEGWTALTYASHAGNESTMDTLLMDPRSKCNDNGRSLTAALRCKHGKLARALLQAGLGSKPKGTLTLDDAPARQVLVAPIIDPPEGKFDKSVTVRLSEGVLSEGSHLFPWDGRGVRIQYTLDGCDPCTVGAVYRGPLMLTEPHTTLRAVAVCGSDYSTIVDAVFEVEEKSCLYKIPDELITGSLRLRTIPEAKDMVASAIGGFAGVPDKRVKLMQQLRGVRAKGSAAPAGGRPGGRPKPKLAAKRSDGVGGCWLRMPMHCAAPQQHLHFHRKLPDLGDFLPSFVTDVQKAIGTEPTNVRASEDGQGLDFNIAANTQWKLQSEITTPSSFLMSKAPSRRILQDCEIRNPATLGQRLSEPGLAQRMAKALNVGLSTVMSLGNGHQGVVAVNAGAKDKKRIRGLLEPTLRAELPDIDFEVDAVKESPEHMTVEYMVDIVREELSEGQSVSRNLNQPDFADDLSTHLLEVGAGAGEKCAEVVEEANSQELIDVDFHLCWDFPEPGKQDYLDGMCFVWAGELAEVIDYRRASFTYNSSMYGSEQTGETRINSRGEIANIIRLNPMPPEVQERCAAINASLQHSGDVMSETGGAHHMTLNLRGLPPEVTDLFFVLAAYFSDSLAAYPNPTVRILDSKSKRELTTYNIGDAGHTMAVTMCSLSRPRGKWKLEEWNAKSRGKQSDIGPIHERIKSLKEEAAAKVEAEDKCWERRGPLLLLRLLECQEGRIMRISGDKQFAHRLLDLPAGVFQWILKSV